MQIDGHILCKTTRDTFEFGLFTFLDYFLRRSQMFKPVWYYVHWRGCDLQMQRTVIYSGCYRWWNVPFRRFLNACHRLYSERLATIGFERFFGGWQEQAVPNKGNAVGCKHACSTSKENNIAGTLQLQFDVTKNIQLVADFERMAFARSAATNQIVLIARIFFVRIDVLHWHAESEAPKHHKLKSSF